MTEGPLKEALFQLPDLWRRQDWNPLLMNYNQIIYHAQDRDLVIEAYLCKAAVLGAHLNLPAKAARHIEKAEIFDLTARSKAPTAAAKLRDFGDHAAAAWLEAL